MFGKAKRRRTESLTNDFSSEELMFAAKRNYWQEGKHDIAKILDFLLKNPDEALKVRNFCEGKATKTEKYTIEKALSIMTTSNLSKSQYKMLQNVSTEAGENHFPSY